MFDVGFSELLLVFVIGLLILGPERLPRVAAQAGRWVGKARRMANQLRYQLEREIALDEFNRAQRPKSSSEPGSSSDPGSSSEPESSSGPASSSEPESSSEPKPFSEPATSTEPAGPTSDAAAAPRSEGGRRPLGHAVEGTASLGEPAPIPGTSESRVESDAAERIPEKAGSI